MSCKNIWVKIWLLQGPNYLYNDAYFSVFFSLKSVQISIIVFFLLSLFWKFKNIKFIKNLDN